MTMSAKVRGELIKLYYQNGMNCAEVLRVYRRNHRLKRGPCTSQALRDLVKKFEETGCTCDRPRSGRPTVPEDTVMEAGPPRGWGNWGKMPQAPDYQGPRKSPKT